MSGMGKGPDTAGPEQMALHDEVSVEFAIEFLRQLRLVSASLTQELDRRLSAHDLTDAQGIPMLLLSEGRCRTAADIARSCNCDPGTLSRTITRLEGKNLLRRIRSTEDRRDVELHPTEAGHQAAALVPGVLAEVLNLHLTGFDEIEWRSMSALLLRMKENGAVTDSPSIAAPKSSPIVTRGGRA